MLPQPHTVPQKWRLPATCFLHDQGPQQQLQAIAPPSKREANATGASLCEFVTVHTSKLRQITQSSCESSGERKHLHIGTHCRKLVVLLAIFADHAFKDKQLLNTKKLMRYFVGTYSWALHSCRHRLPSANTLACLYTCSDTGHAEGVPHSVISRCHIEVPLRKGIKECELSARAFSVHLEKLPIANCRETYCNTVVTCCSGKKQTFEQT